MRRGSFRQLSYEQALDKAISRRIALQSARLQRQAESPAERLPAKRGLNGSKWPWRRRKVKKTADGDSEKDIKLECDDLVRKIIAIRDKKCFTCARREGLQAGHLIRRGIEPVRWDLENVWGQCEPCNGKHEYKPHIFEDAFTLRFGGEALAKLIIRAGRRGKFTYIQISEIRDELRTTLEGLQHHASAQSTTF